MEKGFNSITGCRVNDTSVCIKGNGHFACICDVCSKERSEFMVLMANLLDILMELPENSRKQFWDKVSEVKSEFGFSEGKAIRYCIEGFGLILPTK